MAQNGHTVLSTRHVVLSRQGDRSFKTPEVQLLPHLGDLGDGELYESIAACEAKTCPYGTHMQDILLMSTSESRVEVPR
jgi:hypothetical protein